MVVLDAGRILEQGQSLYHMRVKLNQNWTESTLPGSKLGRKVSAEYTGRPVDLIADPSSRFHSLCQAHGVDEYNRLLSLCKQ